MSTAHAGGFHGRPGRPTPYRCVFRHGLIGGRVLTKALSETFPPLFAASLLEQADYLYANVETDVCGNHLIKNIRALYEASLSFEGGARAAKWMKRATRLLRQELEAQILPDGVHFERSPSYHTQVFADLITIRAIAGAEPVPGSDDALHRMAQALADLTHPDGYIAQFNDSGLNMAVRPSIALEAYARALDREVPNPRQYFAYEEAGYFGTRNGEDYLIVKMGPLGPDNLMAHAHGDWGSFEWSVGGQRVVVDQGVYEYVPGEKRDQSRSTGFHNTAMIGGLEQADFFGAFRCGSRAKPSMPDQENNAKTFEISGFLQGDWRHRRTIRYQAGVLTIEDNAPAADIGIVSSALLHPATRVSRDCNGAIDLSLPSGRQLKLDAKPGAKIEIKPGFWWPNMGDSLEATRLETSDYGTLLLQFSH